MTLSYRVTLSELSRVEPVWVPSPFKLIATDVNTERTLDVSEEIQRVRMDRRVEKLKKNVHIGETWYRKHGFEIHVTGVSDEGVTGIRNGNEVLVKWITFCSYQRTKK